MVHSLKLASRPLTSDLLPRKGAENKVWRHYLSAGFVLFSYLMAPAGPDGPLQTAMEAPHQHR